MDRDLIKEITTAKNRSEFNSILDFTSRVYELENLIEDSFLNTDTQNTEIFKYIPIATIACFESYFKSIIKDLIDSKEEFAQNAFKIKDVKIDLRTLNAVQNKKVTVGEFISHILPFSSLDSISKQVSKIIDQDFFKELRKHSPNQNQILQTENIIQDQDEFDRVLKSIKRCFELRHIFCHEFATNVQVDKSEIWNIFNDCKIFLKHTNDYVWNLIYPNAPQTQSEMNAKCIEDFEKSKEKLKKIEDKLLTNEFTDLENINKDSFKKMLDSWESYAENRAKSSAANFEGGSIYPTIYYSNLASFYNEMIESLKKEYEVQLKK